MRTTITATTLLLAVTALPVLATAPAYAAACADATTTWVEQADGASNAWDEPTNWTDGVPTATSVVCVPATAPDKAPHIASGTTATASQIDAADSGVAIDGTLELAGSMDTGFLELAGGTLTGGATTVTVLLNATNGSIEGAGTVVSDGTATLGELDIDGSLTLNGASSLTTDAHVDTDLQTGLLKIGPTGTLLLDEAGSFVDVVGPLLNLGVVRAVAGTLFVVGWGHEFSPGFSTGTFEAEPDADLWVVRTDLGNGARVTGADVGGPSTIAEDATVTLDATALMRWGSDSEDPEDEGFTGGGELVALNRSTGGGWVGGSVELVVPDGEVFEAADLTAADDATITVEGELKQTGDLDLQDDAAMHVFGVHRLVEGGGSTSSENTGIEVVEPGGLVTAESDTEIVNPLINHGTVQAGSGRLDVTVLDAASLHHGVLDGGRYVVARGATLDLPPVRVNQANLVLTGPGASFGDGLDTLNRVATGGRLELRGGVDLATSGMLSNVGHLLLSSGSRLTVDGAYRQGAAGELVTQVARNGNGRLVATGRRNLAGDLVVRRVAGYRPAVGDRFVVLKPHGRRGGGFDQVQGTRFGKRKFVVEYVGADRVRLRVVKRG